MPRQSDASLLDARLNKAISDILAQNPDTWVEECKKLKERVSSQKKGMARLKQLVIEAADAKVEKVERIASVLKRGPNIDPKANMVKFIYFKERQLARLLLAKVR